jgi:acyl-CoA thioesterase-2
MPTGRVFGGQVIAQSMLAAGRTVPAGRLPHSLHGYFLRAGEVGTPIDLAVERLRDGRSFTARRVHALQGGAPILSMIASFQERQPGVAYSDPMPRGVPDPDELDSALDELAAVDHPVARYWTAGAFDLRHVSPTIYRAPADERSGRQLVWMRARGGVPGEQLVHRALLAYACDQVMLEPVLRRGGLSWATTGLSIASLDHAMWWHDDVWVDDWLLYAQASPTARGGRGLGTAQVFRRDGMLVATIAQEGMVRAPGR